MIRRCILALYMVGALLMTILNFYNAYASGGFQRSHSVVDFIIIAALYLGSAILWPLIIVVGVLQHFGVLPQPITF